MQVIYKKWENGFILWVCIIYVLRFSHVLAKYKHLVTFVSILMRWSSYSKGGDSFFG